MVWMHSGIVPAMQIKSAEFVTSAVSLDGCPDWSHPELAFIGRSNVGKSSMINMLSGRHGLAKVSSTPGKTRMLNFFLINNEWSLVDLPGYGFAKASRTEHGRFNELVGEYLVARPQLKHLFVLIDSRLPPQKIDLEFLEWAGGIELPYSIIFTKSDKLSGKKAEAHVRQFLSTLAEVSSVEPAEVVLSSSKTRTGRNEVLGLARQAIAG